MQTTKITELELINGRASPAHDKKAVLTMKSARLEPSATPLAAQPLACYTVRLSVIA